MRNEHKHDKGELKQRQALPLEQKILLTKRRIKEWYDYWNGEVYVTFSGGKDSTVLKHIVDSMYDDVPSVFVNTGLEYLEIQKFAMSQKNVVTVRPKMRFDEVVKTYGYPVIGKNQASTIERAKNNISQGRYTYVCRMLGITADEAHENGLEVDEEMAQRYESNANGSKYEISRYRWLLDADFDVTAKCCNIMKKTPAHEYEKETGRKSFVATMAEESLMREAAWLAHGCNAYDSAKKQSSPMSFWTEQDVLHYLVKYNVPYCSVYGDIVPANADELEGQLILDDAVAENTKLKTTGLKRTGCAFCAFGAHLEKSPNRFELMKQTHPRQYEYCIGGGEYVDNKWKPNKQGLGMAHVLDAIKVKY